MPKLVNIDKAFSKWFVQGKGRNKIGAEYALFLQNGRIENWSTTARKWSLTRVTDTSWTFIRAIAWNDISGKLVCASAGKLKEVNLTTNALVDIGSIWADAKTTIFTHWKYHIILVEGQTPYYYDGTTLSQVVDGTAIETGEKPTIWTAFSWFTVVVGSVNKNRLYISRPITLANPEYAADRKGTNSENITTQSEVVWIVGTMNNMFVFTKKSIEYMDKNSISTIGWVASLYLNLIWEWDELLNSNCVVGANNQCFYMTKDFRIKTINYIGWTIDTAIWELSDREMLNIVWFLDFQLNDDQPNAFGIRKKDQIHWHLRSSTSTINDIVLIYDITHDSWLLDTNKFYSSISKFNNKYYAWSVLSSNIIEDETWNDDDGEGIPYEYISQSISFWNPVMEKNFQGFEIAGAVNGLANITIDVLIDEETIGSINIAWSEYFTGEEWIGNEPIGGEPVAWRILQETLAPFTKVADHGIVMLDWKSIKLIIKESTPWSIFYLDYLAFFLKPRGNYQLADKF